jgi:hypothetical protein
MTTRSGHDLLQPSSLTWSVRDGRDAYLAENGFTVESYEAKWTPASLLGITFSVPNTVNHRRAIMWHDLHHVATGIGTDPAGEGEIAMWELRRGLRGLDLYVTAIVVSGAMLGCLVSPRRMLRAWQASGTGHQHLFARELTAYEGMLNMNIGQLREALGVPQLGIAKERGYHSTAPKR